MDIPQFFMILFHFMFQFWCLIWQEMEVGNVVLTLQQRIQVTQFSYNEWSKKEWRTSTLPQSEIKANSSDSQCGMQTHMRPSPHPSSSYPLPPSKLFPPFPRFRGTRSSLTISYFNLQCTVLIPNPIPLLLHFILTSPPFPSLQYFTPFYVSTPFSMVSNQSEY